MINRNGLRTAFTAGLGNAFASLSGVGDSQYVSLAVLAVSTGTYGGALALGSQRLLGTALGSVLLLIGYEGLRDVPLPLALAITLGALRLLGGLLKLQVGYKVGGIVIVMGWLVHEGGLAAWIPLRFFWTCFGVLITLLALRLFWPARGLNSSLDLVAGLLGQLQSCFRDLAARVDPSMAGHGADPIGIGRYRALRNQLITIRQQRPALLQELGTLPQRHPATLLMANFDATASRLITLVGGLVREPPTLQDPQLVVQLHRAEADLLETMAGHLGLWERQIRGRRGLPEPPETRLQAPPSWQELGRELNDPTANSASLELLERIASRLMLCRQAEQAIRDGEAHWSTILGRS
ncbi:MAG: FUSC family protein [Cyanobacteria bacterium]|nr:FUSC family protein [Cyanobacteriota bacterium]